MKALIHNRASELVSPSQVPFIVAVSAFETGGFKSPVLVSNNNLFGMKLAKKRPSTAIGENRGHAVYSTLEDSVTDFYLWMEYTGMPRVFLLNRFIKEMKKRSYFEVDLKHYQRGVSTWFDKLYKN